jgi:glycosyltransferase involved in cell wall biosynthesis
VRIAFIAPLCAPTCDTTSRGAQILLADLARAMKERGHDVMVFCAEGSYLAGVDTAPILRDARSDTYDTLRWHVDQWDPDVISQHATDAEAFSPNGHPIVHTMHVNPVDEALTRAAIGGREQLVAVSHDSQRRWRAAGARDVNVITNAIPDFSVRVAGPDPIALIAGRITPEKGTAAAIRAAKRAGVEPVVVGEVCDRGYFARDIVPLLDGVRVMRTLPRERIWALMARAAVTLMPVDWDEPFGLVAAEAQAAGCPVVGYARGALPEVVPQGQGGVLVSAGDEEGLAEAIPIARCMDRVGVREQAVDRFEFDLMADQYEELFAEAATGMVPHEGAAAAA